MDKPPSEGDIWLSRINVSLARSQRVLQSWLPPKDTTTATASSQNDVNDDEDDEDFTAMGESVGVGAKTSLNDDSLPSKSKLSATNQKLLEQLLGKKAANAKLKEQKPHRSTNGLDASKPMPSSSKPAPGAQGNVSDDDEEDGRAAILTSSSRGARKVRDTKRPAYATVGDSRETMINTDAEPPDPREDPATVLEIISQNNTADVEDLQDAAEEVKRPAKRKATSYMDEVLAKKKKKKGKAKSGQ
jgi:hypothetical protein